MPVFGFVETPDSPDCPDCLSSSRSGSQVTSYHHSVSSPCSPRPGQLWSALARCRPLPARQRAGRSLHYVITQGSSNKEHFCNCHFQYQLDVYSRRNLFPLFFLQMMKDEAHVLMDGFISLLWSELSQSGRRVRSGIVAWRDFPLIVPRILWVDSF